MNFDIDGEQVLDGYRNLPGEKKENKKGGCEGSKTNKLRERKENYKIIVSESEFSRKKKQRVRFTGWTLQRKKSCSSRGDGPRSGQ